MNASDSSFQIDYAYFSEALFSNNPIKEGETTPAWPRGVRFPDQEALEGQKQKSDEKASTSTNPARCLK